MNARWKLRWNAGHGAIVPRGWRMAWYEPRRRVGVYFPAPLHWLMRAWRELFYRARLAWRAPGIERAQVFEMQRAHQARQRLADEYARGYMAGWRECYEACLDTVREELSAGDELWNLGRLLSELPDDPPRN